MAAMVAAFPVLPVPPVPLAALVVLDAKAHRAPPAPPATRVPLVNLVALVLPVAMGTVVPALPGAMALPATQGRLVLLAPTAPRAKPDPLGLPGLPVESAARFEE
mmetsp:Transcript_13176/g.30418  ORF Transcript_13176/g.30418 Transcript_13176/m.30418 type:complete len:105 (+) Transcript_13176:744-1058(+)